jgi:hypothetical protein
MIKNKNFNLLKIENWVLPLSYQVLIISIILYGLLIRLKLPFVPYTGPDSIGYLGVAFNYLDSGTFHQIAERNLPYPALLTTLLKISKDISIITLTQHAFGIFGGIFYLKIMGNLRQNFLNLSKTEIFTYQLTTALGLFMLMISPWQIAIEHFSHPESITMPFIMFYVLIALKLYATRKLSASNVNFLTQKNLLQSVIFLLTNYIFYLFQPRFTLACIFAATVFYLFQIMTSGQKKLLVVLLPTLFVLIIANIPLVKNFTYKENVDCQRSGFMFFYNLNTIIPLIKADIDSPDFKKFDKKILTRIVSDFNEAKNPVNKKYGSGFIKTVGYNTDYMMRTYSYIINLNEKREKSTEFFNYYLFKAIWINPFGLIGRFSGELIYFYKDARIFSESDSFQLENFTWADSLDSIKPWKPFFIQNHKVYDQYVSRLETLKNINFNFKSLLIDAVINISMLINKIYIFQCLSFFFVFLLSLKYKRNLIPYGVFILFLYLFVFLINLTISIGATTTISRYVYDQHSLNLLLILNSFFFSFLCLKSLFKAKKKDSSNDSEFKG